MSKILVGTRLCGGPNLHPLIGIGLMYLAKNCFGPVESKRPCTFQRPFST